MAPPGLNDPSSTPTSKNPKYTPLSHSNSITYHVIFNGCTKHTSNADNHFANLRLSTSLAQSTTPAVSHFHTHRGLQLSGKHSPPDTRLQSYQLICHFSRDIVTRRNDKRRKTISSATLWNGETGLPHAWLQRYQLNC